MRMTAIGATLACAVSLAIAAGCGERSEPTGVLGPDLPATVAGAGEEPFVSEQVPIRIVALDDGIAATAYELGAPLVGVPTDAIDPTLALVSSDSGTIDVEVVRSLEPDLILATRSTDAAVLASLRSDPGVPIYTAPNATADDLVLSAFELAIVLGDPVLAREASAQLKSELEDATAASGAREPVRVFVDTGLRIPPDPDSLFGDLIERAGGILVPEDATGANSVEPAVLASAAPEVYLATPDSRVSLASLEASETLATVPAVRDERVVIIERSLLEVSGPDIVPTIAELAAILHPDAS